MFNGFEIMFDCIHGRKTGYQNFRKQLKIAFETRYFCINLGPKLVKIRLRFSRIVAVFSVSVTLVCRNLPVFYSCMRFLRKHMEAFVYSTRSKCHRLLLLISSKAWFPYSLLFTAQEIDVIDFHCPFLVKPRYQFHMIVMRSWIVLFKHVSANCNKNVDNVRQ